MMQKNINIVHSKTTTKETRTPRGDWRHTANGVSSQVASLSLVSSNLLPCVNNLLINLYIYIDMFEDHDLAVLTSASRRPPSFHLSSLNPQPRMSFKSHLWYHKNSWNVRSWACLKLEASDSNSNNYMLYNFLHGAAAIITPCTYM
jgi:hypothetical protein